MKVALIYDRVNKWGGAERLLLALYKIFPQADLFASVYDKSGAKWADKFNVKTSFLQKIPFARKHHELFAFLMPFAFESFSLDEYDVVISITSEAAKGVITKPGTLHICICLTPTRYLWSGYKEYFKNDLLRLFSFPFVSYLKYWDKIASNRPDYYIAISNTVQERIKKYYGKDSEVIYPPVMMNKKSKEFRMQDSQKDYYLVVSRLVSYKRIDLAVQACNKLNFPLKIVGTGREINKLKKIAGKNVEFLGTLSDEELSFCYKNCKALIFPGIEDFGLTIIEAQSFGKPVIAFGGGGAPEIIKDGKTGVLFSRQTISCLIKTLEKFNDKIYNSKDREKNAQRFSHKTFETTFKSYYKQKVKDYFNKKI